MIKPIYYTFLFSMLMKLPLTSSIAQLTKDEAAYFEHSFSVPSPGVILEHDAIIRFELDVTGDGIPERFFSKESLKDGRMGHVWSIYSVELSGKMALIGEETFRYDALAPSAWRRDPKSFGFYSYFPGGGGKGLLSFFLVNEKGIRRLEMREIEPNGDDKPEFDSLFSAQLNGETSKITLKRTVLKEGQGATRSSSAVNLRSGMQESASARSPSPSTQQPPPNKARETELAEPTSNDDLTSSTPWIAFGALIVATLSLLWLQLKKRQ